MKKKSKKSKSTSLVLSLNYMELRSVYEAIERQLESAPPDDEGRVSIFLEVKRTKKTKNIHDAEENEIIKATTYYEPDPEPIGYIEEVVYDDKEPEWIR